MRHDLLANIDRVSVSPEIVGDVLSLEAANKIKCHRFAKNVNVVLEGLSLAVE